MPGSHAHAVNNLLVAELGNAEVIVCACDDGDVMAFWTKQIHDDVEIRQETGELRQETIFALRPFFHQNVGASAWGLDVHKSGRMIAVSANTHEVTVFAFALHVRRRSSQDIRGLSANSQDPDISPGQTKDPGRSSLSGASEFDSGLTYGGDEQPEWLESHELRPLQEEFNHRHNNLKIVLCAHSHNIPSVGFCNSGENDHGWYLISTDILGQTVLWELLRARPIRMIRPHSAEGHGPGQLQHENWERSGWGVIWIDKRAFRETHSIAAAIGSGHYIKRRDRCLIDVTCTLPAVQEADSWNPVHARRERQDRDLTDDNSAQSHETDASDGNDSEIEVADSHGFGAEHSPSIDRREGTLVDATKSYAWPSVVCNPDQFIECVGIQSVPPDSPMFLVNPHYIQLFQSALSLEMGPGKPIEYVRYPVGQHTDPDIMQLLGAADCLKLYVQIPELSTVVVGSSKGRAVVLTCHALKPNPMTKNPLCQLIYTFRVDWLLPFASQERQGQRPIAELVGIAAAPVQGTEGSRQTRPRRWRLLLTYRDHTVLAYELGGVEEHLTSEILIV